MLYQLDTVSDSWTKLWTASDQNKDVSFSGILNDLFDGSQKSDCLLPCTTAHFETKFLNKYASDTSYIDVTFSSEVREAYRNQFNCCIEHCLKGRGGSNPCSEFFLGESHKNRYDETFSQFISFQGEIPNIVLGKAHCKTCLTKSFVNIQHLKLGWWLSWSLAGSWGIASGPTHSYLCIPNLHKMQEEFRQNKQISSQSSVNVSFNVVPSLNFT